MYANFAPLITATLTVAIFLLSLFSLKTKGVLKALFVLSIKRIAVPKALCVLWEHPTKPQKRQSLPFYPLATQGFRNVWNAPRVVIPPPPRTFRKYCAQSEKTATSPSCKQITQPSGAATPRNSDAHKRIAVPKAFCVLREHLPAKIPKRQSTPF